MSSQAHDVVPGTSLASRPIGRPDWVGLFFYLMEEAGEYTGIRFGRGSPSTSHVEWTFLPHISYDGIGAFAELLTREGLRPKELPVLKRLVLPGPHARERRFDFLQNPRSH